MRERTLERVPRDAVYEVGDGVGQKGPAPDRDPAADVRSSLAPPATTG